MTKKPVTIIFAGNADLNERNMGALLDQNLTDDSPRDFVLTADIPRSSPGLRKIAAWLDREYDTNPYRDRPRSIMGFLRRHDLDPGLTEIWVAWSPDADEATEAIVDAAQRMGLPVRNLNDGLDTLRLDDEEPAGKEDQPENSQEQPAADRTPPRRGRPRTKAADKAEPEASAPAEPAPVSTPQAAGLPWDENILIPATRPALAEALAEMFEYGAKLLRSSLDPAAQPGLPVPGMPAAREPAPEEGRPNRRRLPAGVRAYYQDPANPMRLVLRGRGMLPKDSPLRHWDVIELADGQLARHSYTVVDILDAAG